MKGLGLGGERSTKDDPEVLRLSEQGQMHHNQILRNQEKVLTCLVSDLMDLWWEASAVPRAHKNEVWGMGERSGVGLEVRNNLFE